ncbi:MAG: LemA family protein [Chthoniobacterales bacterium]|nr:LemA family protein [Chthoniobacterales bacterium]
MSSLIVLAVALVAFAWTAWVYNRLVKARNQQAEAWSGVDVQLKKRSDLIPPLVECVSAYKTHEAGVFQASAAARRPEDVTRELRSLLAVAEAYPDLKAAENFRKLMGQLVTIEDDLQYARRYYNGSVRDFRNLAESFPSNLIAGIFGFQAGDFFEVESALERSNPEVSL